MRRTTFLDGASSSEEEGQECAAGLNDTLYQMLQAYTYIVATRREPVIGVADRVAHPNPRCCDLAG